MDPVVIVGSGLAGYTLAREVRKLDSQLPVPPITGDKQALTRQLAATLA